MISPAAIAQTVAVAVASNSGPAGPPQVRATAPEQQQEADVGEPRPSPNSAPRPGARP